MAKVRCLFAKEIGTSEWYLWFAMAEATWDAGEEFDSIPSNFRRQECWVDIDDEEVNNYFNVPNFKGKLHNDN